MSARRRSLVTAAGLILAVAAPATAQRPAEGAAPAPPDYRNPANWLCRPGRADVCAADTTATAVAANGALTVERPAVVPDPVVDCFYVYPTVSTDPGDNSDLVAGEEERRTTFAQFAPFAARCRPFAPLYRQMTLGGLRRSMATGGARPGLEVAYSDVRDAFRDYLTHDAGERPFVLIGHSQGAALLKRLVADEIDGKPVAARLAKAFLIGTNVEVAAGRDRGGDLATVPLCRTADQTGCVVTYASFRADSPPPAGSRFGRAAAPGREVGCTNPAALARGEGALHPRVPTGGRAPTDWAEGRTVTTPFVALPGLLTARCATADGATALLVTTRADPADPRTDRIDGDVVADGTVLRGWGLHLADMNLAMGDLLALIPPVSPAAVQPAATLPASPPPSRP